MEELNALAASGKIYDGCPVRAIGTVRIRNGQVYIESMQNLVDIGGTNFEKLISGEMECTQPKGLVIEDKKPIAELDKEMGDLKDQLSEVGDKNAQLTQELFKALMLIETLTKQLDNDQKFATTTVLDLTNTIMDLKSKLKAASDSSDAIQTEIGQLRRADTEHRVIIGSLQHDMRQFESEHVTALAKQHGEKVELEKQVSALKDELSQRMVVATDTSASTVSIIDTNTQITTIDNDQNSIKTSTRSKLKKLFGMKKSASATQLPNPKLQRTNSESYTEAVPQQIGAHRSGAAAL